MQENRDISIETSTERPTNKSTVGEFAIFGWQGISFLHPKEWNISKLSKDYSNGEVFLDDGFMVRVELYWHTPASSFYLEKIISNNIDTIEKETKRKKLPFSVQRKLPPPAKKIFTKERNGEFFILESNFRAFCIAWYCKACGRVLLMRVYSKKEEDIKDIVSKIYSSLEDHPDDKMTWGLYDLVFHTPKDYKLADYSLKSGYLKLSFNKGKDSLDIERWALGNMLLKEKKLTEWFSVAYAIYNNYLSGVKLEEKNNHTEFNFSAIQKRGIPIFTRKNILKEGKVWYCKETNRIFVLLSTSVGENPILENLSKDVICHK